jgi:hypothetical protein
MLRKKKRKSQENKKEKIFLRFLPVFPYDGAPYNGAPFYFQEDFFLLRMELLKQRTPSAKQVH